MDHQRRDVCTCRRDGSVNSGPPTVIPVTTTAAPVTTVPVSIATGRYSGDGDNSCNNPKNYNYINGVIGR